jgi:hypothetical protein
MNQGNEFGECEIAFETKLWQEAGRPFQSQALSKGKKIKKKCNEFVAGDRQALSVSSTVKRKKNKKMKRVCGRRPAGRFCLKHCQKGK